MSQEKGSGLALTSMILGIISIVLCFGPLTGIPALIIGIVALVKINKGTAEGNGYAITGIITGALSLFMLIIVIPILAGMLLPALSAAREKARRINCATNLKQIGLALKQYSMDYNDQFPPYDGVKGFKILIDEDYLTDLKIYTCPSNRKTGPVLELNEDNCAYVYKGGLNEESPSDMPIAWDKDGNHRNFGNILYVDGRVKGYSGSMWKQAGGITETGSMTVP